MKHIYLLLLSLALTLSSTTARAHMADPLWGAAPQSEIRLSVHYTTLRIQHAADKILEIYDITGVKVATQRIESADISLSLNLPKGYYIAKIGNFTRKISLY